MPKCLISIEVVESVSPESITQSIVENNRLSIQSILDARKKSITDDDDIVATSEILTLRDPLSQCKITYPGRSKNCKHNQCFDINTCFLMNQKLPTFTCPICNIRMDWKAIVLDEFFLDIIQKIPKDMDSIEIQPNGDWEMPKENKVVMNKSSDSTEAQVFCLDDSPVKKAVITIDLTLTDDDEPATVLGKRKLSVTE
jgi:E3 SUMO-protein ligase PIAS1